MIQAVATPHAADAGRIAQSGEASATSRRSYTQILRSSALIGGASLVTVGVSIVRAKTMAVFLGPAGVGLMGLQTAILDVTYSIASLGVSQSGVRQIAEAMASGDERKIGSTVAVLRRTSLTLGAIGAAVLALLAPFVSTWTFGDAALASAIAISAPAVLFRCLADGQSAVIQGTRRIADVARLNVLSSVGGAAVTILFVWTLRERGIAWSLVAAALLTALVAAAFRRRLSLPRPRDLALRDEVRPLLALGVAFMASAVLSTGAAYVIRSLVRGHLGLEAAGYYQSAWAIGGLYVGFILQAMGSDFYPRLTGIANDHEASNRLVNEQARVGLLLAAPGVVATLCLAPAVVTVLYNARFVGAIEPLRWVCLGMALRIVSWPLGYILLAKGARTLFFGAEVAAAVVHVSLALALIPWFGVAGAAMAFFGLYVWHGALVYVLARRLTGFRWSSENWWLGIRVLAATAVVFFLVRVLPGWPSLIAGLTVALALGIHSARTLAALVSLEETPRIVRGFVALFRLLPRSSPNAYD